MGSCLLHFLWASGLFLVYLFGTEVTNPNEGSVFVCVVWPGFDLTSSAFVRSRAS